jgi:hypothetical protein
MVIVQSDYAEKVTLYLAILFIFKHLIQKN